jgi:hypothetical protein
MNKLILMLGIIVLAGGGILYFQKQKSLPPTSTPTPTLSSPSETVPQPTIADGVPAIDSKGYVELFLKNIADKKIPDAIAMMTEKSVPDEGTKQAWGVQYAAFNKLVVKSVEPSMRESWTDTTQSYKVTMDVEMSPQSANGPIPYYGYDTGINIRWVGLEKENGVWKITGFSTGP